MTAQYTHVAASLFAQSTVMIPKDADLQALSCPHASPTSSSTRNFPGVQCDFQFYLIHGSTTKTISLSLSFPISKFHSKTLICIPIWHSSSTTWRSTRKHRKTDSLGISNGQESFQKLHGLHIYAIVRRLPCRLLSILDLHLLSWCEIQKGG